MGRLSLRDIKERRSLALAVVEPVLTGIRDRKVAGSYKRMTPGSDGKTHTVLSLDTASNRLSSSESDLYQYSTNLQNQEKKVARLDPLYQTRDIIIPDPGMVLWAVDYAGAEAIGVAAYSKDWSYLDKLLAGLDTHTELAKHFWGSLPEDENQRKLQREIAKTIKYASSYYAKVRTVTVNLNKEADKLGHYFTEEEVEGYLRKIHEIHPLQQWWEETRRELEKNNGVLWNCFGYRRKFHDPNDDNRLKDGLSFYPQSTVAWLMNTSFPKIWEKIDHPGRREILHQIHDELLGQSYPDEIPYIVRTTTPILQQSFMVRGRELFIPVEWKVGPSWGQMKKLEL